jgi:hypothetical protein
MMPANQTQHQIKQVKRALSRRRLRLMKRALD